MRNGYVTRVPIERDPTQAEPPMPFKPLIPSKVKYAVAVVGVLSALGYFNHQDHKNDRNIYNEHLSTAQSLLNAPDTAENRQIEDSEWSYAAMLGREPDMHAVSEEERQTLIRLLNNNKIQGTPRGKPLK